jgi:hypothetical protein
MRSLLLLVAAALAASAQSIVPPERLRERWRTLQRLPGEEKLQCRVRTIQPSLNLAFRFQTGYSVEVPMRQYQGKGHWWAAVLRVTPKSAEREPVWLVARLRIPPVPDTKATGEFTGSYLVGEGEYRVDMLLIDDSNRVCTAEWNIRAKLKDKVREVRPGLPPGVVDDLSLRRSSRMRPGGTEEGRHDVSILVHAAAAIPGRMRMRGYDRMLLLSALSSLVERLPVRKVRLTVFSMDKQQEVYHTPDLSLETFREAMDALNRLELGTVDYSTLTNRKGHVDLVSELLERELATDPDAVIFIGPVARWTEKLAAEDTAKRVPSYYIQLRPFRMAHGLQPDTLARTVRQLGGRTKEVYSPEDFAEAIQALEALLEKRAQ